MCIRRHAENQPKEYQNQNTTNEFFAPTLDIYVLVETINDELSPERSYNEKGDGHNPAQELRP